MTPDEVIRYLRREHATVEYPVAHCRKDHQNWRCDTVKALDVATEALTTLTAERARILAAAREASFTLFRPGFGRGEAHGQAMEVVPLEALVALLGDAG